MIFSTKRSQIASFEKHKIEENYRITLSVNDIHMELVSEDETISSYIQNNYLNFSSPENEANYTILFLRHNSKYKWGSEETEAFLYDSINFDEIFYYRLSKHKKEVVVVLPKKYKDWEIDNFLKLYFASIAINHNILLLHASAIIKDNKAVLFTGQSGAGKSTISRLSGYDIIHDDIIALSILDNGSFCLQTIPFKVNYTKRVFTGEIDCFYRIFQNPKTYGEDVPTKEKLMHILFSVWSFDKFTHHSVDNKNMTIDFCVRLSTLINVRKIYFTKTTDFLKII